MFLDWLANLEDYFDQYDFTDTQFVRSVKMKLVGSIKSYWQLVLLDLDRLSQDLVTMWEKMKPTYHRNHLLDQLLCCGINEDDQVIIARFINGLRAKIKCDVSLHSPKRQLTISLVIALVYSLVAKECFHLSSKSSLAYLSEVTPLLDESYRLNPRIPIT